MLIRLTTEIFQNTIITTNYDRLIESAIKSKGENATVVSKGVEALSVALNDRNILIKIHGDIQNPSTCILSKNQYSQVYGDGSVDMKLPIPKLLKYHFLNSSLFFLGCSLQNDRTMEVFQRVKLEIGDAEIPQHFAVEQAPDDEDGIVRRNAELVNLGITPIWYQEGQHEYVQSILELLKNELRYRQKRDHVHKGAGTPVQKSMSIISRIFNFFK